MKELIKVTENDLGKVVSARELHKFILPKSHFFEWIKNRIKQYGFVENQDFTTFSKVKKGRPITEYLITLDMACILATLQRNDKGKEARQYLLACKNDFKDVVLDVESDKVGNELVYNDITLLKVVSHETIGLSVKLVDFYRILHANSTDIHGDIHGWFRRIKERPLIELVENKHYTTGRILISLEAAITLTKEQVYENKVSKEYGYNMIMYLQGFKEVVPQDNEVIPQIESKNPIDTIAVDDTIRSVKEFAPQDNENSSDTIAVDDTISKDKKLFFLRQLVALLDTYLLDNGAKGLNEIQDTIIFAIRKTKGYDEASEHLSNLSDFILSFQKLLMSDNVEHWNNVKLNKVLDIENSNYFEGNTKTLIEKLKKEKDFLRESMIFYREIYKESQEQVNRQIAMYGSLLEQYREYRQLYN